MQKISTYNFFYKSLVLILVVAFCLISGLLFSVGVNFSQINTSLILDLLIKYWDGDFGFRMLGVLTSALSSILGITISVSLIIVSLTANRYTPKILNIFIKSKFSTFVILFNLGSILYTVWLQATLRNVPGIHVPQSSIYLAVAFFSISVFLLIIYFYRLFYIFNPLNVIEIIKLEITKSLKLSVTKKTKGTRRSLVDSIEQISDISKQALKNYETTLTLEAVKKLGDITCMYLEGKSNFHQNWFFIDEEMFPEHSLQRIATINQRHYWLESKMFMQFQMIFTLSVNHMKESANAVAIQIRRIGEKALKVNDQNMVKYSIRQLNTLLKIGVQAKDQYSVYNLLYQYTLFAQQLLVNDAKYIKKISKYYLYYGLMAQKIGMYFVLKTVFYDLSILLRQLYKDNPKIGEKVLDELLQADKMVSKVAEEFLIVDLKKTLVFIALGLHQESEKKSYNLLINYLKSQDKAIMQKVVREMNKKVAKEFWEITDRGNNFNYVAKEDREDLNLILEKIV